MLLAQEAVSAAAWAQTATAVAQLGFAVFVAVYLLVIKGPKELAEFQKVIAAERERADKREVRRDEGCKEDMKLIIAEQKTALDKVLQHCERESMRRDASLTVVDKSLQDVGEVLEQVRDELRTKRA